MGSSFNYTEVILYITYTAHDLGAPLWTIGWAGWWGSITAKLWCPGPISISLLSIHATAPCLLCSPRLLGKLSICNSANLSHGLRPCNSAHGYLCALSSNFKTLKKFKILGIYRSSVREKKRIWMFGLSPLLPPFWNGEPAVCYVSLGFSTFRSLPRNRRLQWKTPCAIILAWCRPYHLTWAVEMTIGFDLDVCHISQFPPSINLAFNHHPFSCWGMIFI